MTETFPAQIPRSDRPEGRTGSLDRHLQSVRPAWRSRASLVFSNLFSADPDLFVRAASFPFVDSGPGLFRRPV